MKRSESIEEGGVALHFGCSRPGRLAAACGPRFRAARQHRTDLHEVPMGIHPASESMAAKWQNVSLQSPRCISADRN